MPKHLQTANRRGGRISQRLLAKTWQFSSLFSEGPCFCSHLLKVKGAVLKMLSGSFPIIALSNHTTFIQTQTDAIVLLKYIVSIMQKNSNLKIHSWMFCLPGWDTLVLRLYEDYWSRAAPSHQPTGGGGKCEVFFRPPVMSIPYQEVVCCNCERQ